MARVPSEYATNTVACKLWSLVNDESPIEFILGQALFDELSNLYTDRRCWLYSSSDFAAKSQLLQQRRDLLILVPQLSITEHHRHWERGLRDLCPRYQRARPASCARGRWLCVSPTNSGAGRRRSPTRAYPAKAWPPALALHWH